MALSRLNITYGINRSFPSETRKIWVEHLQGASLLMPVQRPERSESATWSERNEMERRSPSASRNLFLFLFWTPIKP